jgi:uncharacterized protein
MKICLKTQARNGEYHQVKIELSERLPAHFERACQLDCQYQVSKEGSGYLIQFSLQGNLELVCQRCLHAFSHPYAHQNTVAVCDNERDAEKLLSDYESLVERTFVVDLKEIITDELHLSAPLRHPKEDECDTQVSKFIR